MRPPEIMGSAAIKTTRARALKKKLDWLREQFKEWIRAKMLTPVRN